MLDHSQYTRAHLPGGMALGICCAGRWPEPTQNSSGASSFVRPARDFYSALLPCARNPQCPTQCRTPCARNSQCRTSSPKTAASIRRKTSFLYITAPVAGGTALQIRRTGTTALGTALQISRTGRYGTVETSSRTHVGPFAIYSGAPAWRHGTGHMPRGPLAATDAKQSRVHRQLCVLLGTSAVPYSPLRGIHSALPSAVLPVRGLRSAVPRAQRWQHQ